VGVDDLCFVVGRDVFTFPVKGIAGSVDKLIVLFANTETTSIVFIKSPLLKNVSPLIAMSLTSF
jgi:hypothetical protein